MAYHPQTDGEMKRLNQEVEIYLHIFYGSHSETWVDHIPMAEFIHNHHPHSTTGKSPFYLMLGYKPQAIPDIIETTHLPALEEWLRNLDVSWKEAFAAHKLAQQLMKNQIKSKFTPFEVNDKVWLKARNLKQNILDLKFVAKREGPFTITQVLSPLSYELKHPDLWKIHPVFHALLLTPYQENKIHRPNFLALPPDLIDNEEECEIDWILKHFRLPPNITY